VRLWVDAVTESWRRAGHAAELLNGDRSGNSLAGVVVPVRQWVDAVTESWRRERQVTEILDGIRPGNLTAIALAGATLGRFRHGMLAACASDHGGSCAGIDPAIQRRERGGGAVLSRNARTKLAACMPSREALSGNRPGNSTAGAPGRCDLGSMPVPKIGGVRDRSRVS